MPAHTRRGAVTLALGAMLPLPAFAADDAWADLARGCRAISPEGDLAVRQARAYGLRAKDCSAIFVSGRRRETRRLVLVFGDWATSGSVFHNVNADGVQQITA